MAAFGTKNVHSDMVKKNYVVNTLTCKIYEFFNLFTRNCKLTKLK